MNEWTAKQEANRHSGEGQISESLAFLLIKWLKQSPLYYWLTDKMVT